MGIIETTAGSVTTQGAGSLVFSIFHRKNAKSSELPLHEAERDPASEIRKVGTAEVTPSGTKLSNLKWVETRNDFPDGSLLRLNMRFTTVGSSFGQRVVNVILRVRAGAALNELGIICPTDKNSARSRVYVIGRYDVLTAEEVANVGLDQHRSAPVDTFGDIDGLSAYVNLTIKERETSKPIKQTTTTVVTASGETKHIVKLAVKRRIRLPS